MEKNPTLLTPRKLLMLLERHMHTVPFPLDPMELYFSCFPPVIQRMRQQGLFVRDPGNTRVGNMVKLMQERSTYISMELEKDQVFWIRIPEADVPVPDEDNGRCTLNVPSDLSRRSELLEWYERANGVANAIETHRTLLRAVFKLRAMHAGNTLQKVWPEMANFVGFGVFKREVCAAHIAKQALDTVISDSEKRAVIDMLTAGSLLPEREDGTLVAWVGYP